METLTASGFTATLNSGSKIVTGIASTAGLLVGEPVTGAGIAFGTTIEAVDSSTSITLSADATLSGPQIVNISGMSSSITVPDSFVISGDQTATGLSVIQVQLNISFADDPDLTATLTHYDADGDLLGTMTLFSAVGAGSTAANFTNTIFDDNSATPIQNASAPFSGTYDPQESLATYFAPAGGQNVQGTWVLTITNIDWDNRHHQWLVADFPEATAALGHGRAGR